MSKLIEQLIDKGFDSIEEYFELIETLENTTETNIEKYNQWEEFDGTKSGLLKLERRNEMDIGSNGSYPGSKLSNFAGHRFTVDGVECYSMEGFLQGLKFKSADMQVEICKLIGIGAKRAGSKKNWKQTQTLYWRGEEIKRDSIEYQELLDRAYEAMFEQSEGFRKALEASKGSTLTHSIGRRKTNETVLTIQEFTSRLTKLRERL